MHCICSVPTIIRYLLRSFVESFAPARVSRLVTATYDTSGMCVRGHCIAKKATHRLINIPRGRHIGNFVVARSFRHIYCVIKFHQLTSLLRDFRQFFERDYI